jgi:hypothetical protein
MFTIALRLDLPRELLAREARQIPFAMANAINDVLLTGQAQERQLLGERFTLRRKPFLQQSVKMLRFAKKGALVGELAILDRTAPPTATCSPSSRTATTSAPRRAAASWPCRAPAHS